MKPTAYSAIQRRKQLTINLDMQASKVLLAVDQAQVVLVALTSLAIFSARFLRNSLAAVAEGAPYQEQRGHDLNYHLKISLEEAILGCSKEIQFRALTTCSDCNGKGAKDPNDVVVCKHCNGQGQVRIQQGFLSIQQTCPICKGQGTIVKNPCGTCQGRKRVEKLRKLKVNIPAGIDDGNRIRLSGEGEAGTSGPAGDLYVEVQTQPHAIFKRNGNDLYCESPIQFTEAALGAEITVPTINGKVKITIPKETQTGATFRIRGKGVKGLPVANQGSHLQSIYRNTRQIR